MEVVSERRVRFLDGILTRCVDRVACGEWVDNSWNIGYKGKGEWHIGLKNEEYFIVNIDSTKVQPRVDHPHCFSLSLSITIPFSYVVQIRFNPSSPCLIDHSLPLPPSERSTLTCVYCA